MEFNLNETREVVVIISYVEFETSQYYQTKISRFHSVSDAFYFYKSFCADLYDYNVRICQVITEINKNDSE